MRFQDSWLEEPALRDWLVKVSNDESRAYCRCCGIILRAHKADLVTHSTTGRHNKNAEKVSLDGMTGPLNVQIVTGDDQIMERSYSDLTYQQFQRSITVKRFRPEWQEIEELKDWLEPCNEDNTKAYCKMCTVQLRAHKHDLILHSRSIKHKRCSEALMPPGQGGVGATNPILNVEYETTVDHGQHDVVPSAIVDTIVTSVEEDPEAKKQRMDDDVHHAEDVCVQNLQTVDDTEGGASMVITDVRNGTLDVSTGGDDDRPPQISIIRVMDNRKSNDGMRGITATVMKKRKHRLSAADVIRAIDENEFTGYEMLQILKRIVPKL